MNRGHSLGPDATRPADGTPQRRAPRRLRRRASIDTVLDDPMTGIANLFDASLAFIVALLIVLFAAAGVLDLFDPSSEFTMVKQSESGDMEIITKTAREVRVQKVTADELEGRGVRLGTAYQLDDGRVVYVPEE